MGKFSNKDLPAFLKKPNYYSEDEQFDNETGRNPQVTEECETCDQEPAIAENKVLRFTQFVNEKKKYNPKYDKDGDGDNDFEDYKAFKTDAIKKKKTVAIKEGVMSEIDILAQESKTFKSFVRAFKADGRYKGLDKAGEAKEFEAWLKSIYDSAKAHQKMNESWDPRDAYEHGATSNCCGASVMMGDICSDCGEHCEAEYWDEEGDGENPEELGHNSNKFEYGIGKDRLDMPNGRIMNTPGNSEYMAEGMGHTCHDGSKSMLSEAAHHLIESICESTCSDASMYEADSDPEHQFEGYINEACAYMEKCMYEMVDDGMTINEGWNNESACYESTCEMIKEVCEKLCSEALEIHNDETITEYNDYVAEAIGCYRNGLMEMENDDVNESDNSKTPEQIAAIVANWTSQNQDKLLSLSVEDQAADMGITPEEYQLGATAIGKSLK
jgi:hypothetical protein